MNSKIKAALVINILIVVFEIGAIISAVKYIGTYSFVFYTTDSNLLAGVASLFYVICLLAGKEIPDWLLILKYMVSCLLLVTFLVVITVLVPYMPEGQAMLLFEGSQFFMHLLCPIMFFISFVWLEGGRKLTVKDNFVVLAPTVIYGLITGTLNVIGKLEGPYPFLMVHDQSVLMSVLWAVILLAIAYGTGFMVRKLRKG